MLPLLLLSLFVVTAPLMPLQLFFTTTTTTTKLYVKLLSQRIFPNAGVYAAKSFRNKLKDLKGTKELLGQVCIDNFVFIPFLFYPTYYLTKEIIMPSTTPAIYNLPAEEGGGVNGLLNKVWNKYTSNFYDDVTSTCKIW